MRLGEQALARILGILACAGLIWAGIGFGGYALTAALASDMGWPGAAAITAAMMLIVPLVVVLLFGRNVAEPIKGKGADNILSAISHVAKDRPLLAMLGAALFGAAEVLLSRRKKN